jgi:hypothetical protein
MKKEEQRIARHLAKHHIHTKSQAIQWSDYNPTPEMLDNDPLFDAIWDVIKTWDIGVPAAYWGYTGGTGNHVRAIYDAIKRIK